MPKLEEFEMRLVESMEPSPAATVARPEAPPTTRRTAPTRLEALEALQTTNGGPLLLERVPMLEQIEVWGEVANWTACETSGAATNVFLWDCDFVGSAWNLFDAWANCTAYFSGAEELGEVVPPDTLTGQVWCYLDAPTAGYYLFVAHVETYPDQYYGPDYAAVVDCLIDSASFGSLTLKSGQSSRHPFLANLAAGHHVFKFKQVSGAFFFENLTAWNIPVFELASEAV